MDKEQAKQIIRDTFESPFDKQKFMAFVKNLLNWIQEAPFVYRGNYIPDAFEKHISTLERIGKYTDDENEIDLLIVKLKKETSLERARAMQRNFIAWYLKGSRGGKLKDAALVAFVSPNQEDWRFSLVKMDYRFEEGKSGKVKIKEEFTPARRWSFLVGKSERSHTAQSRLVNFLADDEHNPTLSQLEEAFNIEPVTKEFFKEYRNLLVRTVDALDELIEENIAIRKDFESKNINTVDFAKKLLGQIVFLYFLQRKGWFGVKRDVEWGAGPKDFLRGLFEKKYGDYKNFFNDILEPLFYEALSRERDDDFYSRFNCRIPFLNGGLFEPINDYNWVYTDILLPDELFSNNRRTSEGDIGDGILDVFDRFNFTVKEDEPLEKEVAIDPELLGKLYEKFNALRQDNFYDYKKALASGKKSMEKKFNKKFGVYYTPREIVHYMCQQSLINYLHTALNQELMKKPKVAPRQINLIGPQEPEQLQFHTDEEVVSKEEVEQFVKYGEGFAENELTAAIKEEKIRKGGQKGSRYEYFLPESIRKNAKLIDDILKNIKICDPAVGSGAFPVGMMHEIVKARSVLSTFINDAERSVYNFKRECIQNSLYGVDIDVGACEVTKLRLWLSLIIDEEDIRQIKPLPNLDYKIVCGNSLLGVKKGVLNWKLFDRLEKLKPLYFSETNPKKKQEYKSEIDNLILKITTRHKEFDFEVYFSEVFHQKGGFDVVIANPPYVRQEKIKDQKELLKKQDYDVYNSTSDLYTYFYERSWDILKPDGFSCFISSNKWMRAKYGEKLRRFFKEKTKLVNLIDFGGYPVFEATVDTNIILFQKTTSDNQHKVKFVNVESGLNHKDLISFLEENQNIISQQKLDDKCWTLADEKILGLKEKIEKIGKPLKNWDVKIYFGIKTGFNKAFIIDDETKKRLCREDPKSVEVLKPILRGRDIGRYYYRWAGLWLINSHNGYNNVPRIDVPRNYPAIWAYLRKVNQETKGAVEKRWDKGSHWTNLRNCAYLDEFEKEKIVWQEMSEEPRFVYDNKSFFTNQTAYIVTGMQLKYVISVLNSKVAYFYLTQIAYSLSSQANRWIKQYVECIPIPQIPEKSQQPFIDLVDKILSLTQSNNYLEDPQKQAQVKEYERQIDQMVYELYDLTDEEIKIVEDFEKVNKNI